MLSLNPKSPMPSHKDNLENNPKIRKKRWISRQAMSPIDPFTQSRALSSPGPCAFSVLELQRHSSIEWLLKWPARGKRGRKCRWEARVRSFIRENNSRSLNNGTRAPRGKQPVYPAYLMVEWKIRGWIGPRGNYNVGSSIHCGGYLRLHI